MEIFRHKLHFRIIFVVEALLLLAVQVIQGTALNYIFISQFDEYFTTYFLFIPDFFCVCMFFGTLIVSFKYFNREIEDYQSSEKTLNKAEKRFPRSGFGVLPLSYVSWLVYALILIGKLWFIFLTIGSYREKPQLLQVCMAMASIVFMLLVEGHNWHKKSSQSYSYVTDVCMKTGIEMFDSVEMFEMLISKDNISAWMEKIVFWLASTNFILPTISLYELNLSNFGRNISRSSVLWRLFHDLCLLLIDITFLAVRVHSLVTYKNLTMFMMKNIFHIILCVRKLYLNFCIQPLPSKKHSTAEEIPLGQTEATQTDSVKVSVHL